MDRSGQISLKTRNQKKENNQLSLTRLSLLARDEKYFDTTWVAVNVTTTLTIYSVTAIPQGNAQSQRIGDKVMPLRAKCLLQLYGSSTDIQNFVRVILFRFKPNNAAGSFPLSTGVVLDHGASGVSAETNSPYSFANRDVFTIVKDTIVPMCYNGANGVAEWVFDAAFPPVATVFTAGLTTGANQLFLMLGSDSSAAPHPTVTGVFRLFYTDM